MLEKTAAFLTNHEPSTIADYVHKTWKDAKEEVDNLRGISGFPGAFGAHYRSPR